MLIQNTLKDKLQCNFVKSTNLILVFLLLLGVYWLPTSNTLHADMDPEYRKQLEAEESSRDRRVDGYFDMQYNTVSNIQFTVHSDGRTFYDTKLRRLTGMWPRGSVNGYVFGGGIWVGTQKRFYKQTWDEELQDSVRIIKWDTTRYFSRWDWANPVVNGSDTMIVEKTDSIYVVEYEIDTSNSGKIVDITYNPRSAKSYMAPGRIEDGDAATPSNLTSYRVYFSMDYNSGTGEPLLEESGPAWPIWDDLPGDENILKYDRYFGHYIKDENQRTTATYPKGPAFISGEDIFVTYKDTDLARFNDLGSVGWLNDQGYPLRIQYEQMIYSWGFGDYRDFIFIKYDQINRHADTLWDMWLAPIFDIDIGLITDGGNGAMNDKTCFYGMEPDRQYPDKPDSVRALHNMAYQYSESNRGEAGKGFGYVGFVFLESPAVIGETIDFNKYAKDQDPIFRLVTDSVNFVRKDGTWLRTDPRTGLLDTCKQLPDGSWVCGDIWSDNWYVETNINNMKHVPWYPVKEQLGLRTFRNWANGKDPEGTTAMYNWISYNGNGGWDGPQVSADMRYMMATGPFHMRPGDTSRTVVGLVLAAPGKGGDATGDTVDLAELVRKTEFMQKVYDENFRAPQPPAPAVITSTQPLNNGMVIHWDSTSEMSTDYYEKGLTFMGYRIYRARRTNLDTFNLNDIAGNATYPAGQGPFGWKELRSYYMPAPYVKSSISGYRVTGTGPSAQTFFGVDSLIPLGPYYVRDLNTGQMVIDPASILCVKVPAGVTLYPMETLWAAIEREKEGLDRLPLLEASGWYADSVYGQRLVPVVSAIDSSAAGWGKLYYNHNKFDLSRSALFGPADSTKFTRPDAPSSFIWDSVMLCRLELNVALARINPLFYKQIRVKISKATVDSFLIKYDTAGVVNNLNGSTRKGDAHWITKDSTYINEDGIEVQVGDSINGVWVPLKINVNIDTLYDLSSIQFMQLTDDDGNLSDTFWTISCMILRDTVNKDWLRDTTHFNLVRDHVYDYIESGWIKNIHSADFGGGGIYPIPFSSSEIAKTEAIVPYMKDITNNRTFVDIGDDPVPGSTYGNAYISEVDDPTQTERLLNNVEYYYKVVSFDEGDFNQPTPSKMNVGLEGLPNLVETYPASDRPANPLQFSVIGTEGALGGVFNPQLFALDEERVAQLFAGDTIEVEFIPVAYKGSASVMHNFGGTVNDSAIIVPSGMYSTNVRITNITKDILLYSASTQLEVTSCFPTAATSWVDNAMYRTGSDSITQETATFPYSDMSLPYSRQAYAPINVHFTTGDFREPDFCYSLVEGNMMWGNFGFSFDVGLKQHGGVYRADTFDISSIPADRELTTVVRALSASGDSWTNDNWYLTESSLNGSDFNNRFPILGGLYGYRYVADAGFRESIPADFSAWCAGLRPPRNQWDLWPIRQTVAEQYNTRFDNGPGVYEVTFKPGGVDTLNVTCNNFGGTSKQFVVNYLTLDIQDTYSFNRYAPDQQGVDSVNVSYPSTIEPMALPILTYTVSDPNTDGGVWMCRTPHPKNLGLVPANPQDPSLFYRKYNLYATGWINARRTSGASLDETFATDIDLNNQPEFSGALHAGEQNRYYLSGYSADGDTIDFVHTLNIAGAQWVLAHSKHGRRPNNDNITDQYAVITRYNVAGTYKGDFQTEDKITLSSWGGVSGFPAQGAKIKFAVSNPYIDYTDDMMDDIQIVPNPYVITHQAQSSPYGAEVYFTKLPTVCDIDIFTAAGDLVTSVHHNETVEGTRKGIAIYDLLTKNGQRVQSQTLVALIKEPNGAMTTKHFSVIVGGFRVVE